MRIEYFRGEAPNFGDELNPWLWPRLLHNFFDEDPSTLFIGIGSIIGTQYLSPAKKVVFGAGFVPTYHERPIISGPQWDVRFVRGPRTALALGLSADLGIGDSATLLRTVDYPLRHRPNYIGFMPHWQSQVRGNWAKACAEAGLQLIDPCEPVEKVLSDILGCTMLVTEAMHGAIVADALRIPWVQATPIEARHRDKWLDWADSLGLQLRPIQLWPSSLWEAKVAVGPTAKRLLALIGGQGAIELLPRQGLMEGTSLAAHRDVRRASSLWDSTTSMIAARRLAFLAKQEPMLSRDDVLDSVTNRMVDELRKLQRTYTKVI